MKVANKVGDTDTICTKQSIHIHCAAALRFQSVATTPRQLFGNAIGKVTFGPVPSPPPPITRPHCTIKPFGNRHQPLLASDCEKPPDRPAPCNAAKIAACVNAVVAIVESLSLAAGVGAVGLPVNPGLLRGAPPSWPSVTLCGLLVLPTCACSAAADAPP